MDAERGEHLAQQMKRQRKSRLWHSAAQIVLGGISIALVTFVCFRLGLDVATTGFAYLIFIAPLALMGSFFGSIILSVLAVGCLNYFFAPPLFDFRVDYPGDVVAITAFLTTTVIVTSLTAAMRKAAQETHASQQALIDTIPALVWSALPDGSRDFHSQRWQEYTGLSAVDSAGEGWIAAFHPQDRAGIADKWHSAVTAGEPFDVEARGRSASGEYRWFLVRAEPLRDRKGAIVKWYGSNTDIEDRKRAEETLRESEAQWREVFEHNPAMYFMVDATGTVLSVNTFGAAQLGYTVSELVGQSVLTIFFEEDREFVRRNIAVCLEKLGQSNSWEVRKIRKDGMVLWVRENAKAVRRAENHWLVLIACEDITERKRTEDALRRSEMYLTEAQRVGCTGSFGWRAESGEIIWSDETFRIFGCDRAMKPTLELMLQRTHPEDRAFVRRLLEHALHDAKDWDFEHRLLMPDGVVKYVRAVAHAVKNPSGQPGFVGVVMDVTATRRAEEELHQARTELARVTRVTTVGELTAAIAHEINQPLAGLVSSGNACLRWLAGDTPNLEAARRSVERMINDGNRAGEVINRIRAMIRKSPPLRDWLNINDTTMEVTALVRSEVQRNGISLRTELSNDLPLVRGDRIQLQQVILNLVMNAVEAMSGPSQGPRELLIVSAREGATGAGVEVRDSGTGLDSAALDRLFDAFYTTKPDGMGMGLAISRTIIEAHGGRLWATPNAPRGAIFQFTLPTDGEEVSSSKQMQSSC